MKQMSFRWIALVLIMAMACGALSGCGGKKGVGAVMDKEHVYKAEYFTLPEGLTNVYRMKAKNGKIYVDGYQEKGNYQYKIYVMNEDGSGSVDLLSQYELKDGSYVSNYTIDNEGNIYILENSYFYDEVNPEKSKSLVFLVKLDTSGKEILTIELPSDTNVNEMLVDNKGNIVGLGGNAIFLFDGQGKEIGNIDTSTNYVDSMIALDDGRIMVSAYNQDYTKREVKELIVDQAKLGEPVEIPGNSRMYSFFSGSGYDLYMKDSNNVYGFNFNTNEQVQLLNFIDSDMNGNMVSTICPLSKDRMVCITNDYIKGGSELAVLTKVAPEDVVEKEVLSLAAVYLDYQVSAAVIEFNKKNDKYRITIKDYSSFNTEEDYMAGANKLNTDIISGDVPDILCVNDFSAFNSATSKGLFIDLYKLMEKDDSFKKSDYLENIFAAFEKDGKLFAMVPYFTVSTIIGKTSNVGPGPGWNMDEFDALMASKPDSEAFREMARETIMYYGSFLCMDQFIDYKKGTCNFDSPDFIRLLEFANQYPSQEELYGSDNMARSVTVSSTNFYDENAYRNDKILLNMFYLYNFNDIHQTQMVEFGEEVTFIGFPCTSRNGSAISPALQLAVSAKSNRHEAAWEFLKMLMGDDFQEQLGYGWPVKLSSIEKKKEKEQKPDTYIDENGNEVEHDNTYVIDGKEVKIGKVTDEECEKVMEFLRSLNQVMWYDQTVNDIINEESGAFFSGQKSVEETTKIIQNRVQTYLNEIQ